MLNERLTEAQNELVKLKLELNAERQKNEEARKYAAAAAKTAALAARKPERTFLDAGIQALVCLIVFLVGFFVAMKFGAKSV